MVKAIPLERLMIETDAPYGEIKTTHEAFKYIKTSFSKKKKEKYDPEHPTCADSIVKDRNEPCNLV